MKKFWHYLQFVLAYSAASFCALFPRSSYRGFSLFVARLVAWVPQLGKVSRQNIRAAFPDLPEKEVKRIAICGIANVIRVTCELFWMWRRRGKVNLGDIVTCTPELAKKFEEAKKRGKQIVFITPHHGNWEFAGQYLALVQDYPMTAVMRSPQNVYISGMLADARNVHNLHMIESNGAARKILTALKQGHSIGLLVDQNTRVRDGGVFVDFFGLPVPVTGLPAMLARKNDLDVMLGGIHHEGKDGLVIDGIRITDTVSGFADDAALTQEIIKSIETIVRRYPEEYLWMYKRFQYIPKEKAADEALIKRYPPYATVANARFYDRTAPREPKNNRKRR